MMTLSVLLIIGASVVGPIEAQPIGWDQAKYESGPALATTKMSRCAAKQPIRSSGLAETIWAMEMKLVLGCLVDD